MFSVENVPGVKLNGLNDKTALGKMDILLLILFIVCVLDYHINIIFVSMYGYLQFYNPPKN